MGRRSSAFCSAQDCARPARLDFEKNGGYEELKMLDVILKRFERPDEIRTFDKGKFELVRLGGLAIGRATYEPGWRWSEHVGKSLGQKECLVEHVGMVMTGCATAAMSDGTVIEMHAGDIFYIPPGHDSWVVGDEEYVSFHFSGALDYAKHE
jgi:quercetin dioxygenase-like cupin family protein